MNRKTIRFIAAVGALLTGMAACDEAPLQPLDLPPSRAERLLPASPTAFHALPGSDLGRPAAVVVDQFGRGMPDVPVTFTVVAGGGEVSARVVPTDWMGRAEAASSWILGGEPGENLLLATAEGAPASLAFMATAGFEPNVAVYGLSRIRGLEAHPDPIIGGRYLLHEDGRFTRTYVRDTAGPDHGAAPTAEMVAGRFSRADSILSFRMDERAWTGTVRLDSLFVGDLLRDGGLEIYAASPVAFPLSFPAADGPSEVYDRATPHSFPSNARSRYVILPDGRFGLQFLLATYGFGEYTGRYTRTDSTFLFRFDNPSGPPWNARARIHGNGFVVEYNIYMALSDFEDGWYVRAPLAP